MKDNPHCPVCEMRSWETVREYCYTPESMNGAEAGSLADYFALRRRVLFEVWFPDLSPVILRSIMCSHCGFMTYLPRPDLKDVDAKYRFLQAHERSIGGQSADRRALQKDRRRSERIYECVRRCFPKSERECRLRILDFGGGNGKLLRSFLAHGHPCSLVDYNQEPLPGVEKLGDTLDELNAGQSFDVILCSHVLEHLVNPSEVIDQLTGRLHHGGVLYAEVPMEIWREIPIDRDPVTHVNFFNGQNFMALCQRSELGIVAAKKVMSTYDVWRIEVLVLLAKKGHPRSPLSLKKAVDETRNRLSPGRWSVLQRRVRFRQFPTMSSLGRRAARMVHQKVKM